MTSKRVTIDLPAQPHIDDFDLVWLLKGALAHYAVHLRPPSGRYMPKEKAVVAMFEACDKAKVETIE